MLSKQLATYDAISFAEQIIDHALQNAVSDIHIESYEKVSRIRYRKDGILYELIEISHADAIRLITRLKVLAKCDIAERRFPQDGRFQFQQIDIRISSCPTLFGEKLVLRLLDGNRLSLNINALGLSDFQQKQFLKTITQPQGFVLVTGPTGSGKTVTLYSALQYLNTIEKNISTVEDPVEIQLPGINQVPVHSKIGLDFATVLRTFLRQDPDVIMLGEIRDSETATIAMQAAETGHLVLSTLHTNSALETITRLQRMGIATYTILHSISLIIAQRLVRQLCPHCKEIDKTFLHEYLSQPIFKARGCYKCLQGYQGRFAIYEFFSISDGIAELILTNANKTTILTAMKHEGFQSLQEMGLQKVQEGLTSLAEINRVTRVC